MREFEGKTAVVTGAASGLGLAFARRFAAEGMNVVLADIEEDALTLRSSGWSRRSARCSASSSIQCAARR